MWRRRGSEQAPDGVGVRGPDEQVGLQQWFFTGVRVQPRVKQVLMDSSC